MSTFKELMDEAIAEFGDARLLIELKNEYERETQALRQELRAALRQKAEKENEIKPLQDALQAHQTNAFASNEAAAKLRRPYRHLPIRFEQPDFLRIIELAHAQDPGATERALNYLGYSLVAGELRDRRAANNRSPVAQAEQAALFADA